MPDSTATSSNLSDFRDSAIDWNEWLELDTAVAWKIVFVETAEVQNAAEKTATKVSGAYGESALPINHKEWQGKVKWTNQTINSCARLFPTPFALVVLSFYHGCCGRWTV